MAFAVTGIVTTTVYGNHRVVVQQITPDAAEGTVTTGLSNIFYSLVSERKRATFTASGNTAQSYVNYVINAGTTGTVVAGQLGFSGCVANNILFAASYGD